MIRFVARTYPPCWVLKARIQKHRGKPLLFHDKCPGFFYVHYTTHGTYSFTSHPKDEAIMVKCLAQGHKRRDQPGWDSNSHSGNARNWVQCTRPLGHNTPLITSVIQWHKFQVWINTNDLNACSLFSRLTTQWNKLTLSQVGCYTYLLLWKNGWFWRHFTKVHCTLTLIKQGNRRTNLEIEGQILKEKKNSWKK